MSGGVFVLLLISLAMGMAGLLAFMWTLRHNQYDDMDGAAERILYDDDVPLTDDDMTDDDGDDSPQT